jgi:hypothetical protein
VLASTAEFTSISHGEWSPIIQLDDVCLVIEVRKHGLLLHDVDMHAHSGSQLFIFTTLLSVTFFWLIVSILILSCCILIIIILIFIHGWWSIRLVTLVELLLLLLVKRGIDRHGWL